MRKIEKVAKKRKIPLKDALEKRLNLLKESKIVKWNKNLKSERAGDECPFCYDVVMLYDYTLCRHCFCPPDICDNAGRKGYIVKVLSAFRPIWKKRLNNMIKLFDKWIEKTEKELSEYEKD